MGCKFDSNPIADHEYGNTGLERETGGETLVMFFMKIHIATIEIKVKN